MTCKNWWMLGWEHIPSLLLGWNCLDFSKFSREHSWRSGACLPSHDMEVLYSPNMHPHRMFWQNTTTHLSGDKCSFGDQSWPVSLLIFRHWLEGKSVWKCSDKNIWNLAPQHVVNLAQINFYKKSESKKRKKRKGLWQSAAHGGWGRLSEKSPLAWFRDVTSLSSKQICPYSCHYLLLGVG